MFFETKPKERISKTKMEKTDMTAQFQFQTADMKWGKYKTIIQEGMEG